MPDVFMVKLEKNKEPNLMDQNPVPVVPQPTPPPAQVPAVPQSGVIMESEINILPKGSKTVLGQKPGVLTLDATNLTFKSADGDNDGSWPVTSILKCRVMDFGVTVFTNQGKETFLSGAGLATAIAGGITPGVAPKILLQHEAGNLTQSEAWAKAFESVGVKVSNLGGNKNWKLTAAMVAILIAIMCIIFVVGTAIDPNFGN